MRKQSLTEALVKGVDREVSGPFAFLAPRDGGQLRTVLETCILSCKKRIASLCLMQDTGCLGLVHGEDPKRCYGEEGGRGVHVWERRYTRGGFMSTYGKTDTVL